MPAGVWMTDLELLIRKLSHKFRSFAVRLYLKLTNLRLHREVFVRQYKFQVTEGYTKSNCKFQDSIRNTLNFGTGDVTVVSKNIRFFAVAVLDRVP